MQIEKLLKEIRESNIDVTLHGENLQISSDLVTIPKGLLASIKSNKPAIIAYLKHKLLSQREQSIPAVVSASRREGYPMSSAQQRLWVLGQFDEVSVSYNMPAVYTFSGKPDYPALQVAFGKLLQRHESLRTVFGENEAGELRQFVLAPDEVRFGLGYHDLRGVAAREAQLHQAVQDDFLLPFDLAKGPLLRANLYQLADEAWVFTYVMHHIISDGWSVGILMRELLLYYRHAAGEVAAGAAGLPEPLRIHYKDYAHWQQERLAGKAAEAGKAYWLDQFRDELPVLQLPGDRPRPRTKSYRGGVVKRTFSRSLSTRVSALSQQCNGTLFMSLLAGVNLLLHKYTGQSDLIIGSPVSGRPHADLEEQIGFYVNTLALRTRLRAEDSFEALFGKVKENTLGAYEHQEYPFDELVNQLGVKRDLGRHPLFDVVVALQNHDLNGTMQLPEAFRIGAYEALDGLTSKFDLFFNFTEANGEIHLGLEFSTDLFDQATAERMADHLEQLLRAAVQHPSMPVGRLEWLGTREKHQLVHAFNDTATAFPAGKSIPELFAEQAADTPDKIALVDEHRQLTYRELHERSSQLAHYLHKARGVKPGDLIAIRLDRGADLIVALLGVLKAGAAYLPLDPAYPQQRIEYMLSDARCTVQIDPEELGRFETDAAQYDRQYRGKKVGPRDLAYVMYTSGSTGQPKGVMVEHRSVVRLVKAATFLPLTGAETLLSTGSVSFDATTFEYWGMLLNGGRLVMCSQEVLLHPGKLAAAIAASKTDTMWFTAGWLNQLVDNDIRVFDGLRTILVGGDKLSPAHVARLRRTYPDLRIINGYGPTENTTFSLTFPVGTVHEHENIPIGKPLSNSSAYVLDALQNLVPVGVVGEICVGGAGLARGYLKQPALTAAKFVPHPFAPGEKLYRTGDLGRWLPDGNLEFVGRSDEQVKIRGYRVEVQEVENVLQSHPDVEAAAVIARSGQEGRKELVAYLVAPATLTVPALRTYLGGFLPDYMLPAYYVPLDKLPLTPNGKVDRKQLPDPEKEALPSGKQYIAPSGETETGLALIWQELLGKAPVGAEDDFFALGGHSLLGARMMAAVRKKFGTEVSLRSLFEQPVLRDLAAVIAATRGTAALSALVPGERPEFIPLSFSQRRLWFIDKLQGSVNYHVPMVLNVAGMLDVPALSGALKQIMERHEVLRTVIREANNVPYQEIRSSDAWAMGHSDMQSAGPAAVGRRIRQLLDQPFDLAADYLLRAHLVSTGAGAHTLVIVMHHIVFDGWSATVFTNELVALYKSLKTGKAHRLGALPIQYADYATWQRNSLTDQVLGAKLDYWVQQLKGVEPLNLPSDFVRPAIQSTRGGFATHRVGPALRENLHALSRREGSTLYMTLLAAFKVLLHHYSDQEDICVGTPVANRSLRETEPLIGLFVNTLALRTHLGNNPTFVAVLARVKEVYLSAYAHQEVPFETIVDKVVEGRDLSRNPLFDVLFTLHNNPAPAAIDLDDVVLHREAPETRTAQFDINFDVIETPEGLSIDVEYCADLFLPGTIERLLAHYETLLGSVVEAPGRSIRALSLLPAREEQLILGRTPTPEGAWFNRGPRPYANALPINVRFEQQAEQNGSAIAVIHRGEEWSYGRLNALANQVARVIGPLAGPGACVGVYMDRTPAWVACFLGILKSGAAYVPLDTQNPADRVGRMIAGKGMTLVISSAGWCRGLNAVPVPHVLLVDEADAGLRGKAQTDGFTLLDRVDIEAAGTANPVNRNAMQSWAYVLYTSGSTGEPKGAILHHEGAINHVLAEYEALGLPDGFRFLQSAGMGSDISVWQLLGPLLKGGAVVIADKDDLLDHARVISIIGAHRVDLAEFVPTYTWSLLEHVKHQQPAASLEQLRWLMLTGEQVPVQLVNALNRLYPRLRVINCYGPCEASDDVVQHEFTGPVSEKQPYVPIGRPLANMNVLVLNRAGALCPVGVPGELFIAGAGVGLGYWNMPDKTAAAFVENPFPGTLGKVLYKTGDIGKWLPDGNLVFLGRVDKQVKIRGHRVELGEIEAQIRREPNVNDCHVLIHKEPGGKEQLIAFVVLRAVPADVAAEETTLQAACQDRLPPFMQPSQYVVVERMPVNLSDKVDEKQLLQHYQRRGSRGPGPRKSAVPRNETEEKITGIWKTILRVEDVGLDDNFFEVGGHSLLATRVMMAVRKELQAELSISDLFRKPTIRQLAAQLLGKKQALLPPILPQDRPERIPLSFSQERIWFIDKLHGSTHYHMPAVIRLSGKLDRNALEKTFRGIVDRHEALRTVFRVEEGVPHQVVLPADAWALQFSAVAYDETLIGERVDDALKLPFDLASDFMLRVQLLRMADDEHLLILVMHHIASDGWSMTVLIRELMALYRAARQDVQPDLAPLPVQYIDYTLWQRKYLSKIIAEKIGYWERQLAEVTPLHLPTDFDRPAIQANRGDIVECSLDKELTGKLHERSKREGVTLFVTLLTAFKVLLHRYTGQEDICVGTPVANRMQKETEPLIGCFINTLALRSTVTGKHRFNELLAQVKEMTLQAYQHQEVPFEMIIDRVAGSRDLSRTSLFQVLFSLDNNEDPGPVEAADLTLMAVPFRLGISKFDLSFNLTEDAGGLHVDIIYNTDLFRRETIAAMSGHFQTLLRAVAGGSTEEAGALEMLTPAETGQLVSGFNPAGVPYPRHKTMADLFDGQALKTPGNRALVFGEGQCTYRQLQENANRVAHHLRNAGLRENAFVAICLDDPFQAVVAMLGVWKAGGAYVPIDPDFPEDRIDYILKDAEALFVITNARCNALLPAGGAARVLIDAGWAAIERQPADDPAITVPARQTAYVIYTSGSTGRPKGVMVTHQNLADYFHGLFPATGIAAYGSFALLSTLAADLGYTTLFGSLLSGGTLHLFAKETLADADRLHAYFKRHAIDCFKIVPSHWKALHRDAPLLPGKAIIFGGEELTPDILATIRATNPELNVINHYGPTETTIGKLLHRVEAGKAYEKVPVGAPFSNARVYVLNAHRKLCPVGVPGELFIAGHGVAAGYHNKPGLTAEKFTPDPYSDGGRMYQTGDLVRRLPDGNIVFLGRVDSQVKVRGHRVELGEIESTLRKYAGVKQAVVRAVKDADGQLHLVAYVVPGEAYQDAEAVAWLGRRLPAYMVPARFVALEALPLTPNGKVDHRALPDPGNALPAQHDYVRPEGETETGIAATWERLLHVPRVGAHDNFFRLGGHSLLAMRAVAAIRKGLGKDLTIRDLFLHPTVRELAALLAGQRPERATPALAAAPRPAAIPLSFPQERLWFIDKLQGSLNYHIPIVLRLRGSFSRPAMDRCMAALTARHEALRTVFRETENGPVQVILPAGTPAAEYHDWQNGGGEEDLRAFIAQKITAPFNLEADPGIRFSVVRLSEAEHVLVIVMHHIASDGWSRSILVNELVSLYKQAQAGQEPVLPPLPVQYADYALWQRSYLSGSVLEGKLAYWVNRLKHVEPLNLPLDFARPALQSTRGDVIEYALSPQLSAELAALSGRENSTLFMTLLAAFKVFLYRYTGQHDICVGTPVANRLPAETEPLIGCFINTLALRTDLAGNPAFTELLARVRETTLSAYQHQDVPYENIVVKVVEGRDTSRNPLFDVMFSLNNNPASEAVHIPGLELAPEPAGHTTSQFDLSIDCRETPEGLRLGVEYCCDLFTRETVARMIRHFEVLLSSVAADASGRIDSLSMLPEAEKMRILGNTAGPEGFNRGAVAYDNTRPLNVRFEEVVAKYPEAVAVVGNDGEEWTYRRLNEQANRVAHALLALGVQPGECVAVYLDRSPGLVACLVGILKSGAVYVPLDTQNPPARIGKMLTQNPPAALVTDAALLDNLEGGLVARLLLVDAAPEETLQKHAAHSAVRDGNALRESSPANPPNRNQLRSWAYVLYTSGSTGEPKGAITRHDGAINHILAEYEDMALPDDFRFLQSAGIGSDISVWQMLGPLLKGGAVVIADKETLLDYEQVVQLLNRTRVTLVEFVPTYVWGLVEYVKTLPAPPALPHLAWIMLVGESIPVQLVNQLLAMYPDVQLLNGYGPCEASDDIAQYKIRQPLENALRVPIGRPVANMNIFITDKTGALCPVGVPGEIWVSGIGVGAGYWNRPEKTAASFIPNPFEGTLGDTIYKTGDLGRWLADGNLEFWSRIDNQVKVRGHRVELDEIAALIRTEPHVQDCHLVIHKNEGKEYLIAFVRAGAGEHDDDRLRERIYSRCRGELPPFMQPTHYCIMADFPVNMSDKVDEKELLKRFVAQGQPDSGQSGHHVPPRNETEQKLIDIWKTVLGIETLGVQDDFFSCGGHSLLVTKIILIIRKEFSLNLPVITLFKYSTVEELAAYIQLVKPEDKDETIEFEIVDF